MECGSPDWLPSPTLPETLSSEPVWEALLPTLSLSGAIPGITGKPIRMLERLWRGRGSPRRGGGGCLSFAHLQTQDLRYQPLGGKGTSWGPEWGGARKLARWYLPVGVDLQTKDAVYTLSAMTSGIRRNWIEALRKTVRAPPQPQMSPSMCWADRLWGGATIPPPCILSG